MEWLTFFSINLMGLMLVGYFAIKSVPEEDQTRFGELMQNLPGLLIAALLLFVNVNFVVSDFEALSIFERLPWILGAAMWAVLGVMALFPDKSHSES